jgi:hypothetical protein
MRRFALTLFVLTPAFALPAFAQETSAGFLGSATYATSEGCEKLKALGAGGDRNISTVPETLTAGGYQGWEHGCTFKSVTEVEAGKSWKVVTSCEEGESQWEDTQVIDKTGEGTFKVTGEGEEEPTLYAVCDAPPPAKKDN